MVKPYSKYFFWFIWVALFWQWSTINAYCRMDDDVKFIIANWNTQNKTNAVGSRLLPDSNLLTDEVSEQKLLFTWGIHLYKTVISTQDKSSCTFTVSCSIFTLQAIKKCGGFWGLLIASDRLQRCHIMGKANYPMDAKTKLAIDNPVQKYRIFKPMQARRRKKN